MSVHRTLKCKNVNLTPWVGFVKIKFTNIERIRYQPAYIGEYT